MGSLGPWSLVRENQRIYQAFSLVYNNLLYIYLFYPINIKNVQV
jgi:hypothetical protein